MVFAANSSMVLPHGQTENYFALLFLLSFFISPASDRVSLTNCCERLLLQEPLTARQIFEAYPMYPAAYTGIFFFGRGGNLKGSQSAFVEYKGAVCPSPVTWHSVVPISDKELFGTGTSSELCRPGPCRRVVQPPQLAGVAAGPYKHHALSWKR